MARQPPPLNHTGKMAVRASVRCALIEPTRVKVRRHVFHAVRVPGSQLASACAMVFRVLMAAVAYTPVWAISRPELTASVKAW
jgi:hypothetical protein